MDDHWVLKYNALDALEDVSIAFLTSRGPRPDITGSAAKWHTILGHLGPEAIAHLKSVAEGAIVTGKAPSIIECETCSLSKAHKLVLKRIEKEDPADKPLARVTYDLI